jgi:hypothetical protein
LFARELTGDLASLVKQLDQVVAANSKKKMAAFVVHLTDDADSAEASLEKLAAKQSIKKIPLTYIDGLAGPASYKIAKDADITLMMWVKGTVKVNYALKKGELNKKMIAKIISDTSKILE